MKHLSLTILLLLTTGVTFSQSITTVSDELIGEIDSMGFVYDFDNNQIGQFLPDGYVLDGNNDTIGKIIDSTFYDINNMYMGFISAGGNVYDARNMKIGRISLDDKIYDIRDRLSAIILGIGDAEKIAGFYFFFFYKV